MGFNQFLERTIAKSQQCNRNWDLSKQIPAEDIKTMEQSVTQCSSKQNRVFYKVIHITDREKIEAIHAATDGFTYGRSCANGCECNAGVCELGYDETKQAEVFENYLTTTNSQVLANSLFVFAKDRDKKMGPRTSTEMAHWREENESGVAENYWRKEVRQEESAQNAATNKGWQAGEDLEGKMDEDRSIGIAAGYLTLTANLLGYQSGCCQCFDEPKVKEVLGIDDKIFLLMGVGYGDKKRNRREHHNDPSIIFPSFKKTINVERI